MTKDEVCRTCLGTGEILSVDHGDVPCFDCGNRESRQRIATLEAENATLKAVNATCVHDLSHLQDVNCKLQATVQRLSGPVSEEWVRSQRPGWGIEGVVNATNLLNSLFAARATPPAKEDSDANA